MLICQLTDLHLRSAESVADGAFDNNAMAERALAAVAALDPQPDLVLVTGDVADTGTEDEYSLFVAAVRRHLAMPVYVIPGNHDRRKKLRSVMESLSPPSAASAGRFLHYVVDGLPLRLVMLDTVAAGHDHGELCATRLDFLERSLAAAPAQPTLIAMHHPPFPCGIDFMDRSMLRDPAAFSAIVARHPQVRRIICGHVHRSVVGQVAHVPAWIGPSAGHQLALSLGPDAPGALALDPPAYSLHRWTAADGLASHVAFVGPSPVFPIGDGA